MSKTEEPTSKPVGREGAPFFTPKDFNLWCFDKCFKPNIRACLDWANEKLEKALGPEVCQFNDSWWNEDKKQWHKATARLFNIQPIKKKQEVCGECGQAKKD